MPFDNTNGFTLSDGSTTIVLENDKNANARGAKKYAKVLGYGMATKAVPFGKLKGSDLGLDEAIKLALEDAKLNASDIDTVFGFANGNSVVDAIELDSLNRVFENHASKLNLVEVKDHVGEARAAAAALALAHASLMLSGEIKEDIAHKVDGTKTLVSSTSLKNVLCISYAAGGTYTAVIITK
jgi:3-oxoacyl-[acyl-carrier-protein] synthase II